MPSLFPKSNIMLHSNHCFHRPQYPNFFISITNVNSSVHKTRLDFHLVAVPQTSKKDPTSLQQGKDKTELKTYQLCVYGLKCKYQQLPHTGKSAMSVVNCSLSHTEW